ncbi:DUF4652 domain-containing protein [Clostridium thailandense]|uniref:DUF4652 domain-containing protein n=1 Tax=Clostridium thailandense TaxID=2794346 RepID=A0A949TG34_9CLOT|nr:DUF4652 domain-containing protein [Clostridium thailandense]MBV7271560.1 DUF4652 domain-containing protein [Clostridium thailandense]MCH5136470.1 DUF4652 domain-containing protein [Clostridiaceae bacterium UIB06]
MRNLKIKTRIYALCSISIALVLGLTACSQGSNKPAATSNNESNVQQNSSEKANTYENSSKETKEINNAKNTVKKDNSNAPKFIKTQLSKGTKPSFSTPWITSVDGTNNACIDGRGSEASEEGIGKILVKDKGGNIFSFEISNNKKLTPRYIEWINDENLLFITSNAHGTVSNGGNLYLLNVNTGETSVVLETPDKKQQIVSAKKSGNNINLKVDVYEDDQYNKSHVENWTIYSFDINLSKKMEVKNSEGKLICTINGEN